MQRLLPTLFQQRPEGGNAKWAQRVVKEWNKYLGNDGHKVVIRYMPGDPKKTYVKFNNELSKDGKTMIQSRGMIKYITSGDGWGGFNPKDYATIIAQNQGTFVFAKKDIPEIPPFILVVDQKRLLMQCQLL